MAALSATSRGCVAALSFLTIVLLAAQSAVFVAASPVASVEAAKALAVPVGSGSYGSLADTFHAIQLLSSVSPASVDSATTCAWLKDLPAATSAEEAFQKLSIAAAAKCKSGKALAKESEPLLSSAASSSDLYPLYHAAVGYGIIKSQGWSSAKVPSGLEKAAAAIISLKQADGTWAAAEGGVGSVASAGVAFESLASLHTLKLVAESQVSTVSAAAEALLSLAAATQDDHGNTVSSLPAADESSLAATAAAVAGYLAMAAALKDGMGVRPARLAELGRYLVGQGGAPVSLAEGAVWGRAMAAMDSNPVVIPVFLSAPSQLSLSGDHLLKVSVSTSLGKPVPGAAVKLMSAAVGQGVVASDKDLSPPPSGDTAFALKLFSKASTLGAYALKFKVIVTANANSNADAVTAKYTVGSPATVLRTLQLTAAMGVPAVTVAVMDGDRAETESKLDFSKREQVSALPATHLQKLQVSLSLTTPSGKPFVPHQAVLQMTNDASGLSHSYLLKSAKGALSVKLNLLESMSKLFHVSGEYSLTLVVGDEAMDNSFVWNIGTIDLDLPAAAEGAPKPPLKPSPLSQRFAALPEIHHIFRKPEKRPMFVVSYAFVALALLPLLILLTGLALLGVNLNAFPTSGLPLLSAFAFHGGIAALLVLFVAFWVQLNLFTTLKLVLFIGVLTTIPGHEILAYLADVAHKVKKE